MATDTSEYQNFSDALVARLPKPATGQRFYYDSKQGGLALRVSSTGARSFLIISWDRTARRTRRFVIGKPGAIGVDAARAAVRVRLGDHAIGKPDPFGREAKRRSAITLRRAFNDYLAARTLKARTRKDYVDIVESEFEGWLECPLADISRDDVEQRHREITQRSPARANLAFRVLNAVYNFAAEKYEANGKPVVPHNPVRRLSGLKLWNRLTPRKSAVPVALMPALFKAAAAEGSAAGDALVLIGYTGLRRNEALLLKWTDVDLKRGLLHVTDTKNRLPLALPLSRQTRALLQARHRANAAQATPSLTVFAPAFGSKLNPLPACARIGAAIGHPFTPHDLRRTLITAGRNAGLPEPAVKALVNHALPSGAADVTSGYYSPTSEELAGFAQALADYLDAGGKPPKPTASVVPMSGRRHG